MALQVTTQHERGECRRRLEFSPGKKDSNSTPCQLRHPKEAGWARVGEQTANQGDMVPRLDSGPFLVGWVGRWPRGYGEVVASLDGGVGCVGPQPSAESFSKLHAGDPNMATPHVPWSRSSLLASSGRVNSGGCVTDLNCLSPFCLGIPGSVGRSVVSATAMPNCGYGGYTPCPNLLQHEAISAVRLHVLLLCAPWACPGKCPHPQGPRSVHRRETRRWWSVVDGGEGDETTKRR